MASIIAGTWSLISSSAEVISKARGMTVGIHRLLQPDAVDLHEADRRRLVGLQRRVQCMVQPLNFLLLWSKSRDDRVQQVVLSAQELLFDIYTFIEDLSADPNGSTIHAGRAPSSRGSGPLVRPSNATKSEQLDFFLRELDFTCISVNMAITMETRAPPGSTPDVSLLAFLRAHRRIKEMEGCSGHLCALLGCLYKGADGSGCWSPALSLATFKVIARGETAGDGTRAAGRATSSKSCPRFGLVLESRLPLGAVGEELGASGLEGLNASARLDFPIASILDAHLVTTGQLNLAASPASPCAGAQELQVDSLALVWSDTAHHFAFVFDASTATADAELQLTPLDAVYLARLCAVRENQPEGEDLTLEAFGLDPEWSPAPSLA
ncbi:RING finger protein B [Durusdinium trenchii]|uniref:RING finger protein B n=1 Tax=Durusdinium trenchii TaxID=1381693 RepID=A0ABP0IPS6_9DINO